MNMKETNEEDLLLPRYFYNRLTDITPAALAAMGAKACALDIDNTVTYDGAYFLPHGVRAWVRSLQAAGIRVILLSNTYTHRARFIAKQLGGVPYLAHAGKPRPEGFYAAARRLGVAPGEIAMIGDQLYTDIKGANLAGAIPVRVRLRRRELLRYFYYKKLRREERNYLISKGYGENV